MSDVLVFVLELIGTVAFAVSGAIVGIKKQMDLFGVIVLGICTAVGGGIVRDLILGVTPPVTFQNPVYTLTAAAVSVLMFLPHMRARIGRHEPVVPAVGGLYAVPADLRRPHHRRGRRRAARRLLRRAAVYLRAAFLRLRVDRRRADLRAVLARARRQRRHALRRRRRRRPAPARRLLPLEPPPLRLPRIRRGSFHPLNFSGQKTIAPCCDAARGDFLVNSPAIRPGGSPSGHPGRALPAAAG